MRWANSITNTKDKITMALPNGLLVQGKLLRTWEKNGYTNGRLSFNEEYEAESVGIHKDAAAHYEDVPSGSVILSAARAYLNTNSKTGEKYIKYVLVGKPTVLLAGKAE